MASFATAVGNRECKKGRWKERNVWEKRERERERRGFWPITEERKRGNDC